MILEQLRKEYHRQVFEQILSIDEKGVPSNADRHSKVSVPLANGIVAAIKEETSSVKSSGQTSGNAFEKITAQYLQAVFQELNHLRGGQFQFFIQRPIDNFEQYEHLAILAKTLASNKELRSILSDYIISPDIVIGRLPVEDKEINQKKQLLTTEANATLTPLRSKNSRKPVLHASISCKWTIRSDRSQNARTEGLNLIRNRKGHTPHIAIVTAEPYPSRIASLALGTGDIDCVYHFALPELIKAAESLKEESASDLLDTMVSGKRLRDISDLPFDLIA
jgi:hypothetical protein